MELFINGPWKNYIGTMSGEIIISDNIIRRMLWLEYAFDRLKHKFCGQEKSDMILICGLAYL